MSFKRSKKATAPGFITVRLFFYVQFCPGPRLPVIVMPICICVGGNTALYCAGKKRTKNQLFVVQKLFIKPIEIFL